MAFNDTTKVLQPLTGETQRLEAAIATTHPSGATALNNAIYVALREFGRSVKQAGDVRRQAIAVFSDGEDTASLMTFDEVLNQARRSGVSIYTIALQSRLARQNHTGRRYFSQSDFSMKTLAQDTGGLSFFPERIQDLAGVYGRIAADIGAQYPWRMRRKTAARTAGSDASSSRSFHGPMPGRARGLVTSRTCSAPPLQSSDQDAAAVTVVG